MGKNFLSGAAIATNIVAFLLFLLTFGYIYFRKLYVETWTGKIGYILIINYLETQILKKYLYSNLIMIKVDHSSAYMIGKCI
jgi:hypothetical protein